VIRVARRPGACETGRPRGSRPRCCSADSPAGPLEVPLEPRRSRDRNATWAPSHGSRESYCVPSSEETSPSLRPGASRRFDASYQHGRRPNRDRPRFSGRPNLVASAVSVPAGQARPPLDDGTQYDSRLPCEGAHVAFGHGFARFRGTSRAPRRRIREQQREPAFLSAARFRMRQAYVYSNHRPWMSVRPDAASSSVGVRTSIRIPSTNSNTGMASVARLRSGSRTCLGRRP